MSSRFHPPALPTTSRPGRLARLKSFLVGTWSGRILVLSVLAMVLEHVGVPVPDWLWAIACLVFFGYLVWGGVRLLAWMSVHLLWRIRSKLIISYLFIAVVPVVLLVLFFGSAAMLFTGLVASHLVSAETSRQGRALEDVARTALVGLPADASAAKAALEPRLAAARAIHPQVSYALSIKGQLLLTTGSAPGTLPSWWKGPGFSGLVETEKGEVLRAVWAEGSAHLALDVPVDETLFADLFRRTGIRMLSTGGRMAQEEGGIHVRVGEGEARRIGDGEISGMPFVAPTERLDWATGEASIDPLAFEYHPWDFLKRLSPGQVNMADVLVKLLTALGLVFIVMYCVALLLGLLLARSITKSVHGLYAGTERLRQGDFHHRIRVTSRDQLGALGDSFNTMAQGIQDLLREQVEKQRLEEELRIARQIQMSLLPPGVESLPGLRIAALCLPAAEVGGDYYDLLPLSETRMGLLVADVSGKGTSAALYMAELKGLVLSLSRIHESPAKLLVDANRILAANMDSRSFVTMTYAVLDVAKATMRYARAGHSPIIHYEAANGRTRLLTPPGLGLGLDKRGEHFEEILQEAEVPLVKGDLFLFFTDGLSEAMNMRAELFGEDRLRDVLERGSSLGSEEIKELILAEIKAFVGEAAQHDDMTLVLLKVA